MADDKAIEMRESLAKAKSTLAAFMNSGAAFDSLDDNYKWAIERLAKKATSTTRSGSTLGFLMDLFKDTDKVNDFELFKATKMGFGEMRKKVHYAMKKSSSDQIPWVYFDNSDDSWVCLGFGGDQPEEFPEDQLPVTR